MFVIAIIAAGCSSEDTADQTPDVDTEDQTPDTTTDDSSTDVPVENLSYYDNFVGPNACAGCHSGQMGKWETSWHTQKTAEGPALGGGDLVWDWVPSKWDELDSYLVLDRKDSNTIYVGTKKYELDEVDYSVGSIRKQRYMIYYDGSPQEAWLATTEDGGISWNLDKSETVQFEGNKERAGYNFLFIELRGEDDIRTYGTWRTWQEQCISCHTTGFNPNAWDEAKEQFINGEREDLKDTFIADLRISCESCHGPGKDHVSGPSSENIINPAKLSKDDPTRQLVCTQCHTRNQTNLVHGNGSNDYRGFKIGTDTNILEFISYTRPAWGTGNRQVSIDGKGRRDHQQDMDILLTDYIRGGSSVHGAMACFDCHDSHNVGNNANNPRTFGEAPIDNCITCHANNAEEMMQVLNGSTGWDKFGHGNYDNEGGRSGNKQHIFNFDEEGRSFGLSPDQYIWALKKDGNASEVDGWESIWPWEIDHYENELGQRTYIGAEPWNDAN